MGKLFPKWVFNPNGGHLVLNSKKTFRSSIVAVSEWSKLPGFSELFLAAECQTPDQNGALSVVLQGDGVRLTHSAIAEMSDQLATDIGLPPAVTSRLHLSAHLIPSNDKFRIKCVFRDSSGRKTSSVTEGAIRKFGAGERIPEPIFSVLLAAQTLSDPIADQDKRFEAISTLCDELNHAFGSSYSADNFINKLDITYASNVSIRSEATRDGLTIEPLLLGKIAQQAFEEGEETLVTEEMALLSEQEQKVFLTQAHQIPHKPAIRLREHSYVYLPKAVRVASTVIQNTDTLGKDEREAFIRNPRPALRSAMDKAGLDDDPETLFIPTEEYSQRVKKLGFWKPPVLPWAQPSGTSWLPERCGVRIGIDLIEVLPEKAAELVEYSDEALKEWCVSALPANQELPATNDVRAALEQVSGLQKLSQHEDHIEQNETLALNPSERSSLVGLKHFLIIGENIDDVGYSSQLGVELKSGNHKFAAPPKTLISTLKSYQQDGLNWLAAAQTSGHRGALLADDMGLGKTLQTLVSMAWRRENQLFGDAPKTTLIVAPTALVQNWLKEMDLHFQPNSFGEIVIATGPSLKDLRTHVGRDTHSGKTHLNIDVLRRAGVILTTYETLRDYHISFAKVPLGMVVFDEIQKLKNPETQVTQAAKTVNAKFWIGLTGTPVENKLHDLWSLSDVLWPGLLGSAQDFNENYSDANQKNLDALKNRLQPETEGGTLPFLIRRMKRDRLEDLPEKNTDKVRTMMPSMQADVIRAIIQEAKRTGPNQTSILAIIQRLRAASLHPIKPCDIGECSAEEYISKSARLTATIQILDNIAAKNEKALIFLESLDLQQWLAGYLKVRFKLAKRPMVINGGVPGTSRQDMVDKFQEEPDGFGLMILSPKAGGVGLTLTAANHVIHLSRWWNPAVEDQATDRVYRIGQNKPVTVHIPIALHPDPDLHEASFDNKLDALLEKKRALSQNLLAPANPGEDSLSELFSEVTMARKHATTLKDEPLKIDELYKKPEETKKPDKDTTIHFDAIAGSLWKNDYSNVVDGSKDPSLALKLLEGKSLERVYLIDPYCAVDSEMKNTVKFLRDYLFNVAGVPKKMILKFYGPQDRNVSEQYSAQNEREIKRSLYEGLFAHREDKPSNFDCRLVHRGQERLHDRVIYLQASKAGSTRTLKVSLPHGVGAWVQGQITGDVSIRAESCSIWASL